MNHEQLAKRIEERLDKIEAKLDVHMKQATKNETHISWLRGFTKVNIAALFTLTFGLIAMVVEIFIKHSLND